MYAGCGTCIIVNTAILMCKNVFSVAVKKRHALNGRQVEVKKALSKNDMGKSKSLCCGYEF